jgi:hypothetical protein
MVYAYVWMQQWPHRGTIVLKKSISIAFETRHQRARHTTQQAGHNSEKQEQAAYNKAAGILQTV